MELKDSVRKIKGVGEKAQKLYEKLKIYTIEDLLAHYPRGYDAYDDIAPIGTLEAGSVFAVQGTLAGKPRIYQTRSLKVIQMTLRDGTGELALTWFNMPFIVKQFHQGTRYILRGKVEKRGLGLTMVHPQVLTEQEFYNRLHVMQPVYGLTAGLTNQAVTKAVRAALEETVLNEEYIPLEIRKKYDLVDIKTAIKNIHFPKGKENMAAARKRLVFDEFFLFMLAMNQLKSQKNVRKSNYQMKEGDVLHSFLEKLPYRLTDAQMRTYNELKNDLTSGKVASRLIQGDVGSGKTIVAVMALLMTVDNGYQGAMMVPTEVLAVQHYETMRELLEPYGVRITLLVGSMKASQKKEAYRQIEEHGTDIIIGTHALIQERVVYSDLALVITDEQHRFGVRQRERFSCKGNEPHMIVMSATPIPRTLAIILYGDLDLSVIDELPAERLPVKNCVVGEGYRPTAYRFMEKQVAEGRQVYIICPMVEESEAIEAENVMDYADRLRTVMPPAVRIAHLHGKMRPAEKTDIMERFGAGEIDILISTTVVEVGINVPNATVMMIENSERFGLAQLHQLRGRVGRGSHQSYCIFISGNESHDTMERLSILAKSNDGFYIANEDLKLRGPGDLFGVRQSGDLQFKLADIYQDASILHDANEAAASFDRQEVRMMCRKYANLRQRLAVYAEDIFL